jgi:hypothetical protein
VHRRASRSSHRFTPSGFAPLHPLTLARRGRDLLCRAALMFYTKKSKSIRENLFNPLNMSYNPPRKKIFMPIIFYILAPHIHIFN